MWTFRRKRKNNCTTHVVLFAKQDSWFRLGVREKKRKRDELREKRTCVRHYGHTYILTKRTGKKKINYILIFMHAHDPNQLIELCMTKDLFYYSLYPQHLLHLLRLAITHNWKIKTQKNISFILFSVPFFLQTDWFTIM